MTSTLSSRTKNESKSFLSVSVVSAAAVGSLLTACAAYYAHWYWKHRKYNLPPGSFGYPLVGEFVERFYSSTEFHKSRHDKHGNVYKTHLRLKPTIVVGGPNAAEWFEKMDRTGKIARVSVKVNIAMKILGRKSPPYLPKDAYKRWRRITLRSLGFHKMKGHAQLVLSRLGEHFDGWERDCAKGHRLRIATALKKVTIDLATAIFFGDSITREEQRHVFDLFTAIRDGMHFSADYPGLKGRTGVLARKELDDLCRAAISRRESEGIDPESSILLDTLLRAKEEETNDEEWLFDTFAILYLAAEATTGTTMCNILLFGAKFPAEAEKVREAARTLLQEKYDGEMNRLRYEDIAENRVIQHFIMEVLRYSDMVGEVDRVAMEDLEFEGYDIPKGWSVILSLHNVNTYGKHWTNPDEFLIDRHEGRMSAMSGKEFVPFGCSSRVCPGQFTAMMMLSVFVFFLFEGFDWEVDEESVEIPRHFPTREVDFDLFSFRRV